MGTSYVSMEKQEIMNQSSKKKYMSSVDLAKVLTELQKYCTINDLVFENIIYHGLENEIIFDLNEMVVHDLKFFEHPLIHNFTYHVKGDFIFRGNKLTNLKYFPKTVKGAMIFENTHIDSFSGSLLRAYHLVLRKTSFLDLNCLPIIEKDFEIKDCNSLTSFKGIEKKIIDGSLYIEDCLNLLEIDFFPKKINGDLIIFNTLVSNLKNLKSKSIKGKIVLDNNAFSEKEVLRIFAKNSQFCKPEDFEKIVKSQHENSKQLTINKYL